jgi:hypothetical protein
MEVYFKLCNESDVLQLTPQITGGKKQSDEGAALFAVRVHFPC